MGNLLPNSLFMNPHELLELATGFDIIIFQGFLRLMPARRIIPNTKGNMLDGSGTDTDSMYVDLYAKKARKLLRFLRKLCLIMI
jgi:hypothetical protein